MEWILFPHIFEDVFVFWHTEDFAAASNVQRKSTSSAKLTLAMFALVRILCLHQLIFGIQASDSLSWDQIK